MKIYNIRDGGIRLGKWQYIFDSNVPWDRIRYEMGWRGVQFGIFKLKSLPNEGEVIQKKHYKGFWIHFEYWLPFIISKQ